MTWLDNLVCELVDQAAIQSVPDYSSELRRHLVAVLELVGRSEYRNAEDQATIRAAREAVR